MFYPGGSPKFILGGTTGRFKLHKKKNGNPNKHSWKQHFGTNKEYTKFSLKNNNKTKQK